MQPVRDWWRTVRAVSAASPLTAAIALLATVVAALVPAAELRSFWGLIDAVVAGRATAFWLAAAAGVLLLQQLLNRLQPLLWQRLAQDARLDLTTRLLKRAARAPLLDFETPAFYDRFSRANKGIQQDLNDLLQTSIGIGRQALTVLSLVGTLAAINWEAALVLVLVGVPAWVMQARRASASVQFFRKQVPRVRYVDYLSGLLVERRYAQEVRLFAIGAALRQRWLRDRRQLGAERIAFWRKQQGVYLVIQTIGSLAYVGALALMGLAALAGRLPVGAFAGAIKAAMDVQSAVMDLMSGAGRIRETGLFVSDVWAFLDAPGALGDDLPVAPLPAAGVAVEGLTFRYPGRTEPVLAEVSFSVAPGELIAVVGENGAGKSTLVKLLLGLYPPSAGSVRVGGVEASAPAGASARRSSAPVFQEYLRYLLTAGENIAVGEIAALDDRARIASAAAGSGADAVVTTLNHGYETQLGKEFQGGQELSGGQWQKLSVARAYMREAAMLVLDEPTAALDPQAEVEVFRRFRELAQGRTAFFISHRLGAARLADRILVLRQGRLVEVGRHDELVARGGEYAALFGAQAAWYRDQEASSATKEDYT